MNFENNLFSAAIFKQGEYNVLRQSGNSTFYSNC